MILHSTHETFTFSMRRWLFSIQNDGFTYSNTLAINEFSLPFFLPLVINFCSTNYFHSKMLHTFIHITELNFAYFTWKCMNFPFSTREKKKQFIQQVRLRDFNVFRHCWFWAILCCQYRRRRGHENCENA